MFDNGLLDKYFNLVEKNSKFFYYIQEYKNYKIVSFDTHPLAEAQDYLSNSLSSDCKGITFAVDNNNRVFIFARPFGKIWNLNEAKHVSQEELEKINIKKITETLDGTLIMVGKLPSGEVLAKTKNNILSEEAKTATKFINENINYLAFCEQWIAKGYTPIFEYISPEKRMVIKYSETKFILIGLRHLFTGKYINIHESDYDKFEISISTKYNEEFSWTGMTNIQSHAENIEGYIIEFENELQVKLKTWDYIKKRQIRDKIKTLDSLCIAIAKGEAKEIIAAFEGDKEIVNYVKSVERKVKDIENSINKEINNTLKKLKPSEKNNKDNGKNLDHLKDKSFKIQAINELGDRYELLVEKEKNGSYNFKDYFLKNRLYKNITMDSKIF